MAIYHFSAKIIGRSAGQSAVAAAAYRTGQRLTDSSGKVKSYTARAARVIFCGIFAPKDAPDWARSREALWNEVERIDARRNSSFCREYEIALPAELNHIQKMWLMQDFVREAFVRRGLVADVAMHLADRGADRRNTHFHVMVPERQVGPGGFAKHKDRDLRAKDTLLDLRQRWARLANAHLSRHGHNAVIDHRSLRSQGEDREPGLHLGHVAVEIERRGRKSDRGNALRAIIARNAERGRHTGERRHEQSIGQPEAGSGANPEKNGGINRLAERIRTGGRPGFDAAGVHFIAGFSGHLANGDHRGPKGGRKLSRQSYRGARLKFALWCSLSAIKETRRIAAQVAEQAQRENTDFRPHVDLWGVGQLPPPPR
jgi:MobA/MobL family